MTKASSTKWRSVIVAQPNASIRSHGFRYSGTQYTVRIQRTGRKEGNVLFNDDSTHFIYGYIASDIW